MKSKVNTSIFVEKESQLIVICRNEFKPIYSYFSSSKSFSDECILKKLKHNSNIPSDLIKEFVFQCEEIRQEIISQSASRNKSIVKIENLLARIKFLKLRFLI